MKILDKEFEIDFFDADINEKIEDGIEKVSKSIKEKMEVKEQKNSTAIREVCNIIFNFFDDILGKGSSKAIFKNKVSLTVCLKAFEDFMNEKEKQDKHLEEISKKYSPNRATRRKKK